MKYKQTFVVSLAGACSGWLAYYVAMPHMDRYDFLFGVFFKLVVTIAPGLVFGLGVCALSYHFGGRGWRLLVWMLASALSYAAAYWSGFFLYAWFNPSSVIALSIHMLVHGAAGLVGMGVLLLAARMLLGKYKQGRVDVVLVIATLLPALLVLVVGVNNQGYGLMMPDPVYYLITMVLWQAFALVVIDRALRKVPLFELPKKF